MAVQNTSGDGDVNVVQFRIERGAEAMATDGRIGLVEQIVVDRTSGQLLSLVIRGEETNTEFEMSATHVLRSTGDHVYLDVSRTDLMNDPSITTPYDPAQYVPVYQGDTMPAGMASRVAAEHEKPVITDVEENAAELIAPETTPAPARTDEGIPSSASADGAPTVKLKRADAAIPPVDWGEAVGTEERPVPTPEASPTPETTGPLMGGKPSTGGMGAASSVPTSTDPALDTVATSPDLPPYTTEHPASTQPPTPNLVSAEETSLTPEAATGIPMERQKPVGQPAQELESLPPPSSPTSPPPLMTAPAQQLANLRDHLPDLLLNMAKSPAVWILAGSLGAGIIGGLVLRRRSGALATTTRLSRAQSSLQEAPGRLAGTSGDIADATGDTVKSAAGNADKSRRQVKKGARRTARRARWFRRGLLLGGAGALFFAPQRGQETRARLKNTLERWRAHIA